MFKNIFKLSTNFQYSQVIEKEINALQSAMNQRNILTKKFKSNFNFDIPDYIVDEIIENEKTQNFLNLHYLINCAVINNKISESNALLLKQVYKLNNRIT